MVLKSDTLVRRVGSFGACLHFKIERGQMLKENWHVRTSGWWKMLKMSSLHSPYYEFDAPKRIWILKL